MEDPTNAMDLGAIFHGTFCTPINNINQQMLSAQAKRIVMHNTGRIIQRLIDSQVLKGLLAEITEHEMVDICNLIPEQLLIDSPLLKLKTDSPLIVVGDIHGQYGHLVRIFNRYGHPPEQKYLFLGNFIGSGGRSIETLALLFAYKIRYPESIFLLRGKQECARVAKFYGFHTECLKRFSPRLWSTVVGVFEYLPAAAIIDERVLCVHSGLSPFIELMNVRGLGDFEALIVKSITLPTSIESNRLLMHFVWSEPDETIDHWDQNPVGQGYLYGPKVVEDYCDRFGLQQIIRSSALIDNGYEFFSCKKLLTLFSAPDYKEVYSNNGVLVYLHNLSNESERSCQLKMMKPIIRLRCKKNMRPNVSFGEVHFELGDGTRCTVV